MIYDNMTCPEIGHNSHAWAQPAVIHAYYNMKPAKRRGYPRVDFSMQCTLALVVGRVAGTSSHDSRTNLAAPISQ